MSKDKDKNKSKEISLGHKHYWTDTQGHAHRVVFDEKTLEKPRATWVVLATVTVLAMVIGAVALTTLRPSTDDHRFVEKPRATHEYVFLTSVAAFDAKPTAIAAGWNDEFFAGSEAGVTLFDRSGVKLETWSFDEPTAPTALAFVASELNASNGLLLAAFGDKVKFLSFSLDQFVPADSGTGADVLSGGADAETEANNAVVRTANRGALGSPKTLFTKSGADIRGIECSGERLFIADYAAERVWRYSLRKLYSLEPDSPEPTPDCELGAPDLARGYPGLKPTFPTTFSVSYLQSSNLLYVASPGLFRVDAFDPETGAWTSEKSWTRVPGVVHSFHGAANPVAVVALDDFFVVGESGVMYDETTKARKSGAALFNTSGDWFADLASDFSLRSDEVTITDVAASPNARCVYVLNADGSVDVWIKN